ncbi:MAG: redoxin domain-containing protein [Acidimicrobiia bacterium]|nr:redoxin domain-containing protein [Acidimicrobiia bacterium]RZV46771.1 MAG: redoxin domain-containing protein [Acidimicrobiia bacterium]
MDGSTTSTAPGQTTLPGQSYAGTDPAPEFPEGLDWLNTADPIAFADLEGKVVLLDFWTYGCINCIHIIPDLKRLEEEFVDELVVIGVHSAKFANEGETDNIRDVVLRYEVEHPVVNDRDFEIWRTWGANAWPTTALVDPAGNVVGGFSGEGVYDVTAPVIRSLISEFDQSGVLDRTPIAFAREADGRPDTVLSYPGKVFVPPGGETLYVADSGHHRIVAADPETGEVTAVYGRGRPGYADGPALEAMFDSPQGMALSPDGDFLYVADTTNHTIRSIELATGEVATILGTGTLGWPPTGGLADEVSINSPWALEERDGLLYIAMAGHHQIWVMDLAAGTARPLVGNARESTLNGPLADAELAQPSGLAFDGDGLLYFADSESSAIRSAEVLTDGVTDIVVGSDDNLFDFGDVDGVGTEARLQHPLGLAYADDGFLYVADTYNSKIKRIDPATGSVETYLGGEQGWQDGSEARFSEPGGVAARGERLYVADTNNHAIRIVDLSTDTTSTLVLKGIEEFAPPPDTADFFGEVVELAASVNPRAGYVTLNIELPPDHKVNEQAPSSAEFSATGGVADFGTGSSVSLTGTTFPVTIPVEFIEGTGTVTADVTVIYCHKNAESLCFIQQLRFVVDLMVSPPISSDTISLNYQIVLPDL